MKRIWLAALSASAAACLFTPGAAFAQDDSLIITPVIPPDFDRDRNVSVTERPRPDYDPLGVRRGSFVIFPRLDLGLGYTSNVYLAETNAIDAPFAEATASVRANSDWSRHQLDVNLSGTGRRFIGESARNENTWRGDVLGRVDLGTSLAVTGEAEAGKIYETPFSGSIDTPNVSLSSYDYVRLGARGQYSRGRSRFILGYTHSRFDFNTIKLPDDVRIDQSNRDRDIDAIAGQAEYALSPSVSLYGQLSYANTDYDTPLSVGIANRDSDGYRALAGISFDLPAFLRGTIAAGYTIRNFNDSRYKDVDGFSAEAQVEWFYTELTTVTFGARRVIEDASVGDTSAYFDNRLLLRIDHELLQNLLVGGAAEYAHQTYIDSDRSNDVLRFSANTRYLVSRSVSLGGRASYSWRERDGLDYNGTLDEFRAAATITFQR